MSRVQTSSRNVGRGFTLIELLVVVAIIVALLAILLPSMGKAIEAGRRAVCASNLHQWSLASINFAADNLGGFPARNFESSRYAGALQDDLIAEVSPDHWGWQWKGYLTGLDMDSFDPPTKIIYCPSVDNDGASWRPSIRTRWRHGDYSYWPTLDIATDRGGSVAWNTTTKPVHRVQEASARSPMLSDPAFESQGTWFIASHPKGGGDGFNGYADANVIGGWAPEPEGINQAGGDGAVAWYATEDLTRAVAMPGWAANSYQSWYLPE